MLGVQTSDHGRRLRDAIALCLTTSVPATAAELSRLSGLTEGEVAAAQRQLAGCAAGGACAAREHRRPALSTR